MNASEFLAMVDDRFDDGRHYPTLEDYGHALDELHRREQMANIARGALANLGRGVGPILPVGPPRQDWFAQQEAAMQAAGLDQLARVAEMQRVAVEAQNERQLRELLGGRVRHG